MKEIFVQKDLAHNRRNNLPMCIPRTQTSSYRTESLPFLGCKLWNSLPIAFRNIKTLASGKSKDGMITVAAGYVENSLVMLVSLLNSIDLHLFYILQLYTSFIFLFLYKFIINIVSYYLNYVFFSSRL